MQFEDITETSDILKLVKEAYQINESTCSRLSTKGYVHSSFHVSGEDYEKVVSSEV